jgi:hypothetical protein
VSAQPWQQTWRRIFEDVEHEARHLDPAKVLITILSAPFVALGFLAVLLLRLAWMLVAFTWSGALVGWREAGGLDTVRGRPKQQDPYR